MSEASERVASVRSETPVRRFRWAPTPSGPLHLGNLFSILLTWLEAREADGEILLRIDDLDSTRARAEFIHEIFQILESLELAWQLGPKSLGEFESQFSQKLSQEFYLQAFHEAHAVAPELFFACDCTRKELPAGVPYQGRCHERGLPFLRDGSLACRVRSDRLPGAPRGIGDAVIFRKEQLFAYHWVSILEDLRWQISDIHRGEDLRSSTEFQRALCRELARRGQEKYAQFEQIRFFHHPLILRGQKKLSKSEGAQAVKRLLSDRQKVFRAFLKWLGWASDAQLSRSSELLELWIQRRRAGFSPRFAGDLQFDQLVD